MAACVVLLGVWLWALRPALSGTLCPLLEASVSSVDQKTGFYMVVFKDTTSESRWQELKNRLQSLSRDSHIGCEVQTLMKMVSVPLSLESLDIVRSWPEVEYVEEETRVEGMQEVVPWHIDRLDQPRPPLDQHFLPLSSGEGIDVYVMDTGIAYSHEEFEGRAKYAGYDPMDEYRRETRRGLDCHGHGTQVASVVAGRTTGIALRSNVYSVRTLDCNNGGVWSVVVAGLDYVFRLASPRHRPAIVVMAFNGGYSMTADNSLQQLYNRGILAVVSAGNDRSDACNFSPGRSVYVLTAAGTDRMDAFYESSNYGSCVDVLAPASEIMAADWLCSSCYKAVNGTSASAALAAGVVALMLGQEPLLSPSQLKSKVESSAVRDVITIPVNARPNTPNLLVQVPGGCGGHYLAPVTISSPNFPLNYPDNLLDPCKWSIVADDAMATQVQCNVTSFVTEEDYDVVLVCDGLLCCGATLVDQLSGSSESFPSYTSSAGALTVELMTDGSINFMGFSLACVPVGGSAATTPPPTSAPSTELRQTSLATSDLPTADPSVRTVSSTDFITTTDSISSTSSVTSDPHTTIWTTGATLEPTGPTSDPVTPITSDYISPTTQDLVTSLPTSDPKTLPTSDPETLPTSDPETLSTSDPPTSFPGVFINDSVEVDEMTALVAGVVSDVVGEAVVLLQTLIEESMNRSLISQLHGRLQQYPVKSCLELASSADVLSGYYWLRAGNGSAVRVFCDVASIFREWPRGYMRVADLNMSRPLEVCPDMLHTHFHHCQKKLCGRGDTLPGCSSVYYNTHGIPFKKVCGRILGYRYGTPNGFFAYQFDPAVTIDDPYVDGVSLTYGSPRKHIWSFAAAVNLSTRDEPACPCQDEEGTGMSAPDFVGHQYFCDTSCLSNITPGNCEDILWDGRGCDLGNSDCGARSYNKWFCVDLGGEVMSDIELRVCANEMTSNEDTPLELVSLYVQ